MTAEKSSLMNLSDEDDGGQLTDNEDEQSSQGGSNAAANGANGATRINDMAGPIFKWTNFFHGWLERYIILKDGVLSYYKSQAEVNFGCRGAIAIKQSVILTHELDDCRFDIKVNDSVWYLRAKTVEERQQWLDALNEQRGDAPQSNLKKHGSLQSLNSTASLSLASTSSYTKRSLGLKEKLAEMETFKDILSRQVDTLQGYFDACANSQSKNFEPYQHELEKELAAAGSDEEFDDPDPTNFNRQPHQSREMLKARMEDHAAMRLDFKGEAYTFKATTAGILHNLALCIETMQQREEYWVKKFEKEKSRRKAYEERVRVLNEEKNLKMLRSGPDFEEGPLNDEEFLDAIDTTLDTLELEEERRIKALESLTMMPELKPVQKHRLTDIIEKVVGEHLEFDLIDDFNSNVWELLCSDGEMKVYRRELEENGIVLDPLKAVNKVSGITAHEICKWFWDPGVRMEWDLTLDSSEMIEPISDDTLIFHQTHKRVWPAAQRDTCFWSHIRRFTPKDSSESTTADGEVLPSWVVVNYSTEHDKAPPGANGAIRATANVAMICSTEIKDKEKFANKESIPRENLICKITYVANVNPGGWVPAGVLRKLYRSVYPKFVKHFALYVIEKCKKEPVMF